ncbi:hypothetical protein GCM10010862_13000 [Devosia nitrariae]|uniref:Uncharacterized protein n=1 Tax=Devosia nitrariae TaxID=2071872 RepID=A0ABQ5W2L3_9HYPH|nr:hypothetical protein GCM10010862_13000 [Devosia nitrariae]
MKLHGGKIAVTDAAERNHRANTKRAPRCREGHILHDEAGPQTTTPFFFGDKCLADLRSKIRDESAGHMSNNMADTFVFRASYPALNDWGQPRQFIFSLLSEGSKSLGGGRQ